MQTKQVRLNLNRGSSLIASFVFILVATGCTGAFQSLLSPVVSTNNESQSSVGLKNQMTAFAQSGGFDLVAILLTGTGSHSTEVHSLSGDSLFQNFNRHSSTAFEEFGAATDRQLFLMDYDGDGAPDLIAVVPNVAGLAEVHIASGASGYQKFLTHQRLPVVGGATVKFAMTDYDRDGIPDLAVIIQQNTGTNTTELHILSGASQFQTFILHTATGLGPSDQNVDFQFADYDGDGRDDLYVLMHGATGSNTTEVHILSAASNFQNFSLHTATALETFTNSAYSVKIADWDQDGKADLVFIKPLPDRTEVHVVAGGDRGAGEFKTWSVHQISGLGPTNGAFQLSVLQNQNFSRTPASMETAYVAPSGDGTAIGSWIAGNPVQGPVQQSSACADPNHPENSLLRFQKDLTVIDLNLCWGGAVYSFKFNGHEFENRITNGALFQIDTVQFSGSTLTNSYTVNPTQGGEGDNRRGSPVTSYGLLADGSGIYGGGHPLNFFDWATNLLDRPDPYNATTDYLYRGLTFTGILKPSYLGNWQATRYQSVIESAQTQTNVMMQIPAMYLKANYDTLSTYDTIKHERIDRPLLKPNCGAEGWGIVEDFTHRFDWNQGTGFSSTCGVVFFTDHHDDFDKGYAIGIYTCTPDLGGSATQVSAQDQSCNTADNAPDGHSSTVIWAEHVSFHNFGHGLKAGANNFYTTIITGTSDADLIVQAQYMYDHGVR